MVWYGSSVIIASYECSKRSCQQFHTCANYLRACPKLVFKSLYLGTHQFDLFSTVTIFISSTFSVLRPLYFDLFTSNSLIRLAYFDLCTSTICEIWTSYWSRSTGRRLRCTVLVEIKFRSRPVGGSKYRKGRTDAYSYTLLLRIFSIIK